MLFNQLRIQTARRIEFFMEIEQPIGIKKITENKKNKISKPRNQKKRKKTQQNQSQQAKTQTQPKPHKEVEQYQKNQHNKRISRI
jgi:hypothetical protein